MKLKVPNKSDIDDNEWFVFRPVDYIAMIRWSLSTDIVSLRGRGLV
jgi:hypothetical protein